MPLLRSGATAQGLWVINSIDPRVLKSNIIHIIHIHIMIVIYIQHRLLLQHLLTVQVINTIMYSTYNV